jgi:hypothetical protein
MRNHFASVLAGGEGAEADESYFRELWESMGDLVQRGDAAYEQDGEALCSGITGDELLGALRRAKNHKAPGEDGLPPTVSVP